MRILIKFCRNFFLWMIDFLLGSISPILLPRTHTCQYMVFGIKGTIQFYKQNYAQQNYWLDTTRILGLTFTLYALLYVPKKTGINVPALTLSLEAWKVFIKKLVKLTCFHVNCRRRCLQQRFSDTFIHFLSLPRMQMEQIEVIIVKISPSIICSLFSFTA